MSTNSEVFWIKYYRHGKAYRESSKTTTEDDAKKLLKLREEEIAKGKLPGIYFEKVTFEELAEDLKRDYALNMRKSQRRVEECLAHLARFFEGYRVPRITSDKVQTYIQLRLTENAENATINRELSCVGHMLTMAFRWKLIPHSVFVERLPEGKPRDRELTPDEEAVPQGSHRGKHRCPSHHQRSALIPVPKTWHDREREHGPSATYPEAGMVSPVLVR